MFDFEIYCIIKRLHAPSTAHYQTYYCTSITTKFLLNEQSNMLSIHAVIHNLTI